MTKDEAIKILSLHLMQCGMMMPIGWLNNHGEGSDFMKAYEMALDALKNEPVRCKDCKHWKDIDSKTTEHEKICEIGFYKIGESGFCSFGERREGA